MMRVSIDFDGEKVAVLVPVDDEEEAIATVQLVAMCSGSAEVTRA